MAAAFDLSGLGAGPGSGPGSGQMAGAVRPAAPAITAVDSVFRWRDRLGAWAVRWGLGRMAYRVEPGLHGLNQPGPDSPVLVTANYKLSYDTVRRALAGVAAWILVLDTKGVNVWCAAGKGSFGTAELVNRLARTGLAGVVRHRRLILPQLSATGVSAPAVRTMTGWQVVWGPVRAADLPAFLAAGNKATPAMREVRFDLADRLVLTPVELVQGLKFLPLLLALAALMALPASPDWPVRFLRFGLLTGLALPVGAVAFPLLLPWLPGRAFGLKGLVLGLASAAGLATLLFPGPGTGTGLEVLAAGLVHLAVVVWLGMNFTGSSTFTCQAGATTEVRTALPWLAAGLGLALTALVAGLVLHLGGLA